MRFPDRLQAGTSSRIDFLSHVRSQQAESCTLRCSYPYFANSEAVIFAGFGFSTPHM